MKYFWNAIKHKWFVIIASLRIGSSLWRAIVHDLSKFTPSELPHYNRQFFGDKNDPAGYTKAWLHHYHRNDHHWEYWIVHSSVADSCTVNNCLAMPPQCVREMVADWMGAGRVHNGSWDISKWANLNIGKLQLHPKTKDYLDEVLLSVK